MFFIGPSANIFVYLLVSAFFVICFYSKSEVRIPEALPGYVIIADTRILTKEVYHYRLTDQTDREEKEELPLHLNDDRSESAICTYFAAYDDPNLVLKASRAPPVIYCFRTTNVLYNL